MIRALDTAATGLVLLKLFGRRGPIGHWLFSHFGIDIVFTWRGVVLALAVMSFPLLVWTARSAIEGVNPALERIARTLGAGEWRLDAEKITCPVRIVWGTEDRLLPWPEAADRYRHDWLPQADWVVLDGIGHCPQLDIPLETAQLIIGFTSR